MHEEDARPRQPEDNQRTACQEAGLAIFGIHLRRIRGGWAVIRDIRDAEGKPMRALSVAGAFQSATYTGKLWNALPFEYFRAFDRMFDAEGKERAFSVRNVLMIGGGGFSYPKHLLTRHEDVRMDVVEIDPAMVGIARKFFYLDKLEQQSVGSRLRIFECDGLRYLEECSKSYDVIINDAFNGSDPVEDLVEHDMLAIIKKRLVSNGIYMINVVCGEDLGDAKRLWRIIDALKGSFAHVYVVTAVDEFFGEQDNYIVLATDIPADFHGANEF